MNMTKDKRHYYDGQIYSTLLDPFLREIRQKISTNIRPASTVIDIGCGTGDLAFKLSTKCRKVVGIELSRTMIDYAKRQANYTNAKNVQFIHADATRLPRFTNKQFDYATISLALHEMSPKARLDVVREAKRIAKTLIIADHALLPAFSLQSATVNIVEFLAGMDHFRNYRDYVKRKGIEGILKECQLSVQKTSMTKDKKIQVVSVR